MRKLHTTIGIFCLYTTSSLVAQTNPEHEFSRQAANLYRSANVDAFFAWFTSSNCSNLLFLLIIASGIYFLTMLTLFLLIHKDVISLKENSVLYILLEDWLTEKETIILGVPQKDENPIPQDSLTETVIQLDLPNLDVLSMETESAKMAI